MQYIRKNKKLFYILSGFTIIMAIICLTLYFPMKDLFQNPTAIKEDLLKIGFMGQVVVTLVMTLQVVFVFLPGEVIEILAGFMYGAWGGMLLCLIGSAIGSSIIYLFVQKFGLTFIDKLLGQGKIEECSFLKKQKHLDLIVFIIFLIPGTPKDIITYFMPLTPMPLSKFLIITSIARIPSIITSTVSGGALAVANYEVMFAVLIITAIVSIIGLYFYKNKIRSTIL